MYQHANSGIACRSGYRKPGFSPAVGRESRERGQDSLLQHVLPVRCAVSEQTVDGMAQGCETVSADLEGDE